MSTFISQNTNKRRDRQIYTTRANTKQQFTYKRPTRKDITAFLLHHKSLNKTAFSIKFQSQYMITHEKYTVTHRQQTHG